MPNHLEEILGTNLGYLPLVVHIWAKKFNKFTASSSHPPLEGERDSRRTMRGVNNLIHIIVLF